MKKFLRFLLARLPASLQSDLLRAFRNVRDNLGLFRAYRYDRRQFRAHSGLFRSNEPAVVDAAIIKAYHRIEKGLALQHPRPGFGRDAIDSVMERVAYHIAHFGPSHTTRRALNTLSEYVAFNKAHGNDASWLEPRLAVLSDQSPGDDVAGGTRAITRDEILQACRLDLKEFFANRYSIRQFSRDPVSDQIITSAVLMAQKTPSVCNRESGCVFVATAPALKAELLGLQNGNRGFGDQADRILVVTSRMDSFLTVGERYQCWIDGGLFAMSLIYALHSLGVGSCCLNWSVEPEDDAAIKKVHGIPRDHAIIMLLAVGHLPPELLVAQSPRRPLSEVLHFI